MFLLSTIHRDDNITGGVGYIITSTKKNFFWALDVGLDQKGIAKIQNLNLDRSGIF